MIYVYVRGRDASAQTTEPITKGSVGIQAQFAFTEDWDGLAKQTIWYGSGVKIPAFLSENNCVVPPETLAEAGGKLRVGVYGTDGETIVQPTVWAEVDLIQQGVEQSDADPGQFTPSLIDQLLAAAQAARDAADEAEALARSVREDADSGAFDGAPGGKGDKGDPGDDYVLTEADKSEIAETVRDEVVPDAIRELQAESQAQQAAVREAGQEVLTSIPEDYTRLSEDVAVNTEYKSYSFTNGKYVPLGPTGGTTDGAPKSYANTAYAMIPCAQGDVFEVTADAWSASAYRLYGFLGAASDGVYPILAASPLTLTAARGEKITAPADAVWLVVNAKTNTTTTPYLAKGTPLISLIRALEEQIDGGSGGSSDYDDLTNKPQIGGVELSGNKTAADLGLVAAENGKGLSTNDYTSADKTKLADIEAGAQKNPDLSGYAKQSWVQQQGYLTQHQSLAAYRTAAAQDTIDEAQNTEISGKADKVVEVTVATDGAVSQAVEAGKAYHFTGNLTALTITATTPGKGQYHLDFISGSTAPTVTLPGAWIMPDGWTVEAGKRYEIDVLDGYGLAQSWEVDA